MEPAEEFGDLLMTVIECNQEPIAAAYCFRYRDRLYTPKMGLDERFKKGGPGQLIVQAVLRDCVGRGITLCDFVGPSADWESKWTPVTRTHHWIWIFRKSLYGRLLHAAKFTARDAVKRIVERFRRPAATA